jgi:superoxide dismutase, Cu-Zn family
MMKKRWLLLAPLGSLALGLALVGCKGDDDDDDDDLPNASASTEIKDKEGKVLGTATFTQQGKSVKLVAKVEGAATKSVQVGMHIHQKSSCDGSTDPPFTSAGDHWNPPKKDGDYGPKDASPNNGYLGELGKIALDDRGNGTLEFTTSNWRVGTGDYNEDVVSRSIILHIVDDTPDDGKGAPRQGCGVVTQNKAKLAGRR